MINVQISTGSGVRHIVSVDRPSYIHELQSHVEKLTKLPEDNFYVVHNGRLAYKTDICFNGYVTVVPRILGGKGGFGSMLRAIGAQIEKTTNREACRDLSGRRLRDINEEKRLKAWIEKQETREEEAAERKKKKLARLCAEPKHEFKDQTYEKERSVLTERVGDAVEAGFKAATAVAAGTSGTKRKVEVKPTKKKTLLDLDIDSDELDTSDDSDEDETECKKLKKDVQVSNDSGHSSDGSARTSEESSQANSNIQSDNEDSRTTENTEENCVIGVVTESMCVSTEECPKVTVQATN